MNRKLLAFVGIGFELVALITTLILIGRYLDAKYDLNGLGVAGGAVLGLLTWSVHVYLLLKNLSQAERKLANAPEKNHIDQL